METVSRRKWTKEEDDRLIEIINDESLNLAGAFRKASEELNRSASAISFRWYSVLNNPEHKEYRGTTCFVTICRKQAIVNKKIALKSKPVKVRKTLWEKIADFFKRKRK